MKAIRCALRHALRCTVVGSGLALVAVSSHAQEGHSREIALDIKPQSMSDALSDWARQTGLQLIFPDAELTNRLAAPLVRGTYTAQAALNQLLAGTELTYEFINERTVSIRERHPSGQMRVRPIGLEQKGPYVRLIDRRFEDRSNNSEVVQRTATVKSTEAPEVEEQSQSAGEKRKRTDVLAEVVVAGTQIRGIENSTAPVLVLDRAYIDSTGISTATGLVETLPQNFGSVGQDGALIPNTGISNPGQGSSVNLRGLGPGTSLVLLNGRRMAPGFVGSGADISALPLSAVERVEILTDGASAIYGSDAVGGVVNFVLRNDFDGAETRLRRGFADGGIDEYRVSQTLGNAWNSGNALLALEYYRRDLLPASKRDFVPSSSIIGSLSPEDENVSAMFTGRQEISDSLSIFSDVLYTNRASYNEGGRTTLRQNHDVDNSQITTTAGLDWRLGGDWQLEASGSFAANDSDLISRNILSTTVAINRFEIGTARVVADGSLLTLPGGMLRLAAGGERRSESIEFSLKDGGGQILQAGDLDQTVTSVFGELYVPIIGPENRVPSINRLELSAAVRYDDYSSFGSSFDPRVGIMWEPIEGLRFRGSYGTSYVAPKLTDHTPSTNSAIAYTTTDPATSTGRSHQLQLYGNASHFTAQESEGFSLGIEFTSQGLPGFQVGLNYFEIDYENQIAAAPPAAVILGNQEAFGSLFIRNPSVAQVNEYIEIATRERGFSAYNPDFTPNFNFDPSTVAVLIDLRRRNFSETRTSGVDFSIRHAFGGFGADFSLGVSGSYVIELLRRIAPNTAAVDNVDTFYNPPDWRLRAFVGLQRGDWAANLFANYTDSYTDNRITTPAPISSYVTLDARLAYDFKRRFSSGFLSGVTISASVQNLLDRDPPHAAVISSITDMGFDPTNSNAMGRFVAVELTKAW